MPDQQWVYSVRAVFLLACALNLNVNGLVAAAILLFHYCHAAAPATNELLGADMCIGAFFSWLAQDHLILK